MKKSDVLSHLRAAKAAHIAWVQRAKLLISGLDIDESAIPVNSTECKFGQWFYGDGQILHNLQNNPMDCMQNVEDLHFKLHDIYLHIFRIYYQKPKKGFFMKLFGSKKKKISEEEYSLAKNYFEQMEEISKKLLEEINRMERRISAISDNEIESLV